MKFLELEANVETINVMASILIGTGFSYLTYYIAIFIHSTSQCICIYLEKNLIIQSYYYNSTLTVAQEILHIDEY